DFLGLGRLPFDPDQVVVAGRQGGGAAQGRGQQEGEHGGILNRSRSRPQIVTAGSSDLTCHSTSAAARSCSAPAWQLRRRDGCRGKARGPRDPGTSAV